MEIIKAKEATLKVEGLINGRLVISGQENLGDSGEVFRHTPWRDLMLALWSMEDCRPVILGIAHSFLKRGKSIKIDHSKHNVSIPISLAPEDRRNDFAAALFQGKTIFNLIVNFPSAESKVNALSLTPERLRCVLRSPLTPTVLKEQSFPATAEAIGFAHMIRSMLTYITEIDQRKAMTATVKAEDESRSSHFKRWDTIVKTYNKGESKPINPLSMTAATFSTKEVYQADEDQYPGVIWWCGVHSMMTDACNKLRAARVTVDMRARFENSNFYGDFKRKMNARGITTVNSKEYYDFLNSMAQNMAGFMKTGTMMSQEETSVFDSLLMSATRDNFIAEETTAGPQKEKQYKTVPYIYGANNTDSFNNYIIDHFSKLEIPVLPFAKQKEADDDKESPDA